MLSLGGSLAAWLRKPRLIRSWAIWFPRISRGSAQAQARPTGSLPLLWVHGTAPRLATPLHVCVGFPGDTPPPSSEAGQPLGASAGQTNWKRLPSLGRVNPGPPATTQAPSIVAAPSQLFLPNKTQMRELRGTSQNTGESHRGPPTTIHRFCPISASKVRAGGPLPATSALISGPASSSCLAVCPQQALTENSKVLD